MKLYTVWSGEYSDRCMHAIFISEEKANKYAEVYSKLFEYEDYWVSEYETEDDKFDINTEVHKFYHCSIALRDTSYEHKGEITTDELWNGFMSDYIIENYEDLNVKDYPKLLILEGKIDDIEEDYALPVEYMVDNRQSYVEINKSVDREPYDITAYSQIGYSHARKIALDEYYKYIAKEEGIV